MKLLSGYKHQKPNYTHPKRSGSCPKASDIRLKPYDRSPEPSAQLFVSSYFRIRQIILGQLYLTDGVIKYLDQVVGKLVLAPIAP